MKGNVYHLQLLDGKKGPQATGITVILSSELIVLLKEKVVSRSWGFFCFDN